MSDVNIEEELNSLYIKKQKPKGIKINDVIKPEIPIINDTQLKSSKVSEQSPITLENFEAEIDNILNSHGNASSDRPVKKAPTIPVINPEIKEIKPESHKNPEKFWEILKKSIGNKIEKINEKTITIPVALMMSFVMAATGVVSSLGGMFLKNQHDREEVLENYVNVEDYKYRYDLALQIDYDGLFDCLKNSVIKNASDGYNPNYETIISLGLLIGKLKLYGIDLAEYNSVVEKYYSTLVSELSSKEICDFPKTLKNFLVENGFNKGVYEFNEINGTIKSKTIEDEDVLTDKYARMMLSFSEGSLLDDEYIALMLNNVEAYAKAHVYNQNYLEFHKSTLGKEADYGTRS